MGYCIADLAYALPEKVVENDFFVDECGIDRAFLENKIGITERRIAAENEPPSVLAAASARTVLEATGLSPDSIDVLVLCTQNPDYRLPTTACLVQHILGLRKSVLAFDINLGCSGFVYALPIAGNFIRTGDAARVLVITVDHYSKIVDLRDKNTGPLFGDAAATALLVPCEDGFGVIDGAFGTDGSGAGHLILPNSGVRKEPARPSTLVMDGREIFKFAVSVVPDSVSRLLQRNGLEPASIRHYVFHQANLYMLREIQRRLALSDDQMVIDMARYGNTVSASIPIAYRNLITSRPPARGDLVVFCGFGVGLSWGTILYRCC
jgi:3-oxoacyl-[acyl-carrier-protein] synthase III